MLFRSLDAAPGVTELVMNRPERFNALQSGLVSDLHRAFAAVAAERSCRVVVLRGEGRHFCAGADLAGHGQARAGTAPAARRTGWRRRNTSLP